MGDKGDKTELKIRFVQRVPMSKSGYKNWTPKRRAKLHKFVYKCVLCQTIPCDEIGNKKALGKFVYDNLWAGNFCMFGYSKGKTRTKVKLVLLAKIDLDIGEDGNYRCRIYQNWRLSRYKWFWVD